MKLIDLLNTLSFEVEIMLFWDNLDFINEYYSKEVIREEWLSHTVKYVCVMRRNKIAIYIK